jgi:hypothetical protein
MQIVFMAVLIGGIVWMLSKYFKQKKSVSANLERRREVAFEDGAKGRQAGRPITDNPYASDPGRWRAYNDGWNSAGSVSGSSG